MKTGRFFDIREIEGNLIDLKLRLFSEGIETRAFL